jgi:hypothetical protein
VGGAVTDGDQASVQYEIQNAPGVQRVRTGDPSWLTPVRIIACVYAFPA